MAKTLEELIRDQVGALVLQNLQLQAENALLSERIVALTPAVPTATPDAPNGDH